MVALLAVLASESLGLAGQPVQLPGAHGSGIHRELAQTSPREKSAIRFGTAESNPATSSEWVSIGSATL